MPYAKQVHAGKTCLTKETLLHFATSLKDEQNIKGDTTVFTHRFPHT